MRKRGRFVLLAAIAAAIWILLAGPGVPWPWSKAEPALGTASQPSSIASLAESQVQPGAAAAADRFASLQARLQRESEAGRFAAAFAMLDAALAGADSDLQPERIEALRPGLERGLTERLAQLASKITAGHLLEAEMLLGALRAGEHPRVEAAVERWRQQNGWPQPGTAAAAPAGEGKPPLAPGRFVRFADEGKIANGWIAWLEPERATLRVTNPDGVTFPSVAIARLEPIEPSAEEAIAVARARTEPVQRWLWLAYLQARGLGDDPRVRALR